MCCNGAEEVPPVEGGPRGFEAIGRIGDVDCCGCSTYQGDGWRQQTVVGADQDGGTVADFDDNGFACAANTRIDNGKDNTGIEIGRRPCQREPTGAHVVSGDVVGYVGDTNIGGDRMYDRFYDADEFVSQAVVGQKIYGGVPQSGTGFGLDVSAVEEGIEVCDPDAV